MLSLHRTSPHIRLKFVGTNLLAIDENDVLGPTLTRRMVFQDVRGLKAAFREFGVLHSSFIFAFHQHISRYIEIKGQLSDNTVYSVYR
jgi:hypothetical protein